MCKLNNGFSRIPHTYQILSYLFFGLFIVTEHVIVRKNQSFRDQIIWEVISGVFLAILCISTFITAVIDPSDPIIIEYHKSQIQGNYFDIVKNNLYCDICLSYVSRKTKHCRTCDRCVDVFDHHCKWINNCVGKRNYKPFILMIVSVSFYMLILLIEFAFFIVKYHKSELIANLGEIIVVYLQETLILIVLIADCNLIHLHAWLNFNSMTTYEFILLNREEEKLKNKQKEQQQQQKQQQLQQQQQQQQQQSQSQKESNSSQSQKIEKDGKDSHFNKSDDQSCSKDFKSNMKRIDYDQSSSQKQQQQMINLDYQINNYNQIYDQSKISKNPKEHSQSQKSLPKLLQMSLIFQEQNIDQVSQPSKRDMKNINATPSKNSALINLQELQVTEKRNSSTKEQLKINNYNRNRFYSGEENRSKIKKKNSIQSQQNRVLQEFNAYSNENDKKIIKFQQITASNPENNLIKMIVNELDTASDINPIIPVQIIPKVMKIESQDENEVIHINGEMQSEPAHTSFIEENDLMNKEQISSHEIIVFQSQFQNGQEKISS